MSANNYSYLKNVILPEKSDKSHLLIGIEGKAIDNKAMHG
jgi:hypothetical protein